MKKLRLLILPLLLISLIGCTKKYDVNNENQLKIAVLSPSGAEILYEIGAEDLIVARTDFCDYPTSLNEITSVGGFDGKTISLEALISSGCNFVYGSKGIHDYLESYLKNFGIELYLSDASSIKELNKEILFISKKTNHLEEGEKLISSINKTLNSCDKKSNLSIYYEVWNTPYMSVGNKSYINDIIQCCGGKNIFADVNSNYPMVSEESIISKNPDIILIPEENGLTEEMIKNRSGWKEINAVKNNRIYFVDSDIFSRPGPRIIQAIKQMEIYCNE